MPDIITGASQNNGIEYLVEESMATSGEDKKSARAARQVYQQRAESAMGSQIDAMEEQKKKTESAGKFNGLMSAISAVIQAIGSVLSIVLPGVGSVIAQAVSAASQAAMGVIQNYKNGKLQSQMTDLQIESQEAQQKAQAEQSLAARASEDLANAQATKQSVMSHLHSSLDNQYRAQEVVFHA